MQLWPQPLAKPCHPRAAACLAAGRHVSCACCVCVCCTPCRYTVAYPCILFYILFKNRMKIMEDQLLRAEGRGATKLENPNCYDLRVMFHK